MHLGSLFGHKLWASCRAQGLLSASWVPPRSSGGLLGLMGASWRRLGRLFGASGRLFLGPSWGAPGGDRSKKG
eukprot:2014327-Pyramimonas_sp.AAC.1